jgi:hypothetical protein
MPSAGGMRTLFGAASALAFAVSAYFFVISDRPAEGVAALGLCLMAFALSFRWPAGGDHGSSGA